MPPEIGPYFTELAERMGRIEANVAGIPELAKEVAKVGEKAERVRIIIEGVDGGNGMKKDVEGVKKDVADIKQYRSDENAVSKAKAGFWTPVKTVIIAVVGSVTASTIAYFLLGRAA